MQAILYIAHGSRVKAGTDQAVAFLQGVQQEVHVSIQEICFLELATPTIAEGIANCVRQGATMIAVMPILLLAAQHAKQDIPREIAEAQKLYPHIKFSYGEPLGIHERIIDTLQARILEKQQPNCEACVLLIGRGSSDPTVKRDLAEIATRLRMKYNYQTVDTCFLYGMGPSFDDWLQQEKERQHQVFIVPYLLFTGILRQSITKRLQGLSNNNMMLCESLGYDVNVKKVLVERIDELLHFKEEGVS
ncbi:sirohydrochlorin chelatase [Lysinibacillus fusiformis]|uniref:sirohydrochlorin chelatase n=1 Tax=Lysinibacillus fusiformis TaxID=28031 RepID=UPI001881CD09|nr:sirohydrochlorin chelatase [Lysinibacillus fusiformis]MBD8522642.1 sirohydrochlorin chelatase [Lysinibacillus fusiformis]MED4886681.1 sirohydrochlorin chelatase [Lysinibacillus fusiformis]